MVKKILICSMCLMLLFGVCVFAENNTANPTPDNQAEMPQGNEPDWMDLPEGAEPPQGMPQNQNWGQMTPPNMDFGGGNMPDGFGRDNTQTQAEQMTFIDFVNEYQTPIISVVLLVLAFVFVKLYKRKNY